MLCCRAHQGRETGKPAPKKGGEIYIHRGEWAAYAAHLAQIAPPEWHDWKNRLFTTDKSAR